MMHPESGIEEDTAHKGATVLSVKNPVPRERLEDLFFTSYGITSYEEMAAVQSHQSFQLSASKTPPKEIYLPVRLPEMFVLFLSGDPAVNPHYPEVRTHSEQWLSSQCSFDEISQRRLTRTDFSYFCAISAPKAGKEELRTVCDWGNWVFPFDDIFDNGELKDDPERAQILVDSLLAGMDDSTPIQAHYHPLVKAHNCVWRRIVKTSPAGVQRRFAQTMQDYCKGSIAQVHHCSNGTSPSLEEMLALRRKSAGVAPLFALVEYAHKLDLPDQVFDCRSIQEIERIGVDLVLLQNDLLSYCKEEREGVTHNMVAVCRQKGMPAQAAFNHIGELLGHRYRDWYLALADLPSWGERVDAEVQEYICGVRDVVRANLNWSFRSKRYFGEMHEKVRRTGIVMVKADNKGI